MYWGITQCKNDIMTVLLGVTSTPVLEYIIDVIQLLLYICRSLPVADVTSGIHTIVHRSPDV